MNKRKKSILSNMVFVGIVGGIIATAAFGGGIIASETFMRFIYL